MFGPFFGLSEFSMTPKMRQEQAARQKRELEEALARAEPWTVKTAWKRSLTLTAASWQPTSLFPVEPTLCGDVNNETEPEGKFVTSPSGQFLYCEKILPKAHAILLFQGSRRGQVMFDGPVRVPALHERSGNSKYWRPSPWMSYTPSEVITQRPGLRMARGHVVVAGLGLGWALVEVLKKRSVTKVTLVEISQELVNWILPMVPNIQAYEHKLKVIVGDAKEVLADLTADVALVDIFPNYGSNYLHVRGGTHDGRPKNIPKVWCWGTAPLADDGGW
jgi:hypothetical protein